MYKEATALNSVAEFHKNFSHPIKDVPGLPSEDRTQLRVNLIQEELNELKDGIKSKDLIEIADALCDIQYVLSGAILEFGLAEKFSDLFNEVQRSNMSKACKNEKEAKETIEFYKNQGVDCYFLKNGNYYIVYRNYDNKIMKSIYYSPADINTIINND